MYYNSLLIIVTLHNLVVQSYIANLLFYNNYLLHYNNLWITVLRVKLTFAKVN